MQLLNNNLSLFLKMIAGQMLGRYRVACSNINYKEVRTASRHLAYLRFVDTESESTREASLFTRGHEPTRLTFLELRVVGETGLR